jgi:Asp-tRNA(Asn)/Glu-tRNA(Gln) amidotransferase B subunit
MPGVNKTMKIKCPELPWECKQRFMDEYHLTEHQAEMMTKERWTANYFEETLVVIRKLNL